MKSFKQFCEETAKKDGSENHPDSNGHQDSVNQHGDRPSLSSPRVSIKEDASKDK